MPSPEQLADAIKYLADGLKITKILDRSVGINQILNEPEELKLEQDIPKGYSNWLTAGEKYGYLDFFQEQLKNN